MRARLIVLPLYYAGAALIAIGNAMQNDISYGIVAFGIAVLIHAFAEFIGVIFP